MAGGKSSAKDAPVLEPEAQASEKAAQVDPVAVPGIDVQSFKLKVTGISRLVTRKMSDADAKAISTGSKNQKSTERDPKKEFEDSIYRNEAGKAALPVAAFEMAALNACRFVDGLNERDIKGTFFVSVPSDPAADLVPLKGPKPRMRTDRVRVGHGTPAIRYRAEFLKWSCVLQIDHDAAVISQEQIVNLFARAGFSIGVGEGRPEKKGRQGWGRFAVEV
jgi:hypothetical protein